MSKWIRVLLPVAMGLFLSACTGNSSDGGDSEVTGVEAAKETLEELRTDALSVVDYNDSGEAGYLDTEALSIKDALENCSLDAETAAGYIAEITAYSIQTMDDINATNPTSNWNGGIFGLEVDINCTVIPGEVITGACIYNIYNESDVSEYNGTIILPLSENDSINPGNFGVLNAQYHGTVPYAGTDDIQTFDFNLTLTQKEYGADINLTNISLEHNVTSLGISDLSSSLFYTFNSETNETNIIKGELNSITLNGECNAYTVIGTLTLPSYVENASFTENNGSIPEKLIFDGNLTNTDTNGRIGARVEVNWLNAATMDLEAGMLEFNVTVAGTLVIPERPEMDLDLTYTNEDLDGDENTFHTFGVTYSYDNTEIVLEGTLDQDGENGTIVINANNGISILIFIENGDIVEGNADTGEGSVVMYDGTLVGTLEYRENIIIILYTDGTFESLP